MNMFAVIRTGGKQYRVKAGDTLNVEKLEAEIGSTHRINEVLMAGDTDKVILSNLNNAFVEAEIVDQFRDKKILVFKKRRRKNYRRMNGHRQYLTRIKITSISF